MHDSRGGDEYVFADPERCLCGDVERCPVRVVLASDDVVGDAADVEEDVDVEKKLCDLTLRSTDQRSYDATLNVLRSGLETSQFETVDDHSRLRDRRNELVERVDNRKFARSRCVPLKGNEESERTDRNLIRRNSSNSLNNL